LVQTLKRQIAMLYFERSGLSNDKEKLAARLQALTGAVQEMSPP
jgi:predicted nuclease of restriction endonuclease-like (RecB) superfamily